MNLFIWHLATANDNSHFMAIITQLSEKREKLFMDIDVRLNMEEKNILYAFGCRNHENTVYRLKWVTVLTVDAKVKRRIWCLLRKLESVDAGERYPCLYQHLCMEMEEYLEAKKLVCMVEQEIEWEKYYGKAV